jgi:sirohydrochlorin ferrochelatase
MDNKKVLVIVSHGSKRKESNQEFKEFIKKINKINSESSAGEAFESLAVVSDEVGKSDLSDSYSEIKGACLEFSSPQLETVIEDLLKEGYQHFDILPLFIFAGYHVKEDIPERMEKLKNNFEKLEYKILDHPAAADDFAPYIFAHALGQK